MRDRSVAQTGARVTRRVETGGQAPPLSDTQRRSAPESSAPISSAPRRDEGPIQHT